MSLLLGVPDRLVREDEATTWETNKIGGTPDWFQANTPIPLCKNCQREMTLVTQVYCPLASSPFHRSLHIFVCPRKPCSMQSCGWRVIRTQQLDESPPQKSPGGCAEDSWTIREDDWGVSQIDWGVDDDDDEKDEKENGEENPQEEEEDSLAPASEETATDKRLAQLSISDQHQPFHEGGRPHSVQDRATEELDHPGQLTSCHDDGSAVPELNHTDSTAPSTGDGDTESSEQVEAEAVDLDDEGVQRMMGLLATAGNSPGTREESDSKTMEAVQSKMFPAYYMNVFAERDLGDETSDDHVTSLLRDYQQREGVHFSALLSGSGKGSQSRADGEKYDKTEVKHGDRQCYKFIKRLQTCPQQCIRYQWSGRPLLLRSGPLMADRCPQCQTSRVFELQLVPPLIPLLRFPSCTEPQVEFGTVLVFTCGASCWSEGQTYREELAVVQHDPDQHLFR